MIISYNSHDIVFKVDNTCKEFLSIFMIPCQHNNLSQFYFFVLMPLDNDVPELLLNYFENCKVFSLMAFRLTL